MGKLQTFGRQYQIQAMTQRHHEIVRLALLGLSHIEIADRLGITPVCVSYTLNSRIVQDKLAILRVQKDASAVDVLGAIRDLSGKCVEVLSAVMEDEGAANRDKIAAARDLLDRAGYAAPKVIKTDNVHTHFSATEIAEIKRRAIEQGIQSGQVLDAEFT